MSPDKRIAATRHKTVRFIAFLLRIATRSATFLGLATTRWLVPFPNLHSPVLELRQFVNAVLVLEDEPFQTRQVALNVVGLVLGQSSLQAGDKCLTIVNRQSGCYPVSPIDTTYSGPELHGLQTA
jgi:hypothetical protein